MNPIPYVLKHYARLPELFRGKETGSTENLKIAKIWSVTLGIEITNEDVAMMMVGLKVARYASKSGFQPDTWVDIAGYAACGYEVGSLESKKD